MNRKENTFNKLVEENTERIHRICSYYNANTEDQKDMYQEILVNIWKSLDSFKGNSTINTWVYRVAVNTALSFTGKAYKQMKLMINRSSDQLSLLVDDDEMPLKLDREKQFNKLQAALNTLSVIDKALISLSLEGLASKDIAEVIGITESNVKVKIHRIKTGLKTELNK